jgi:hypothetical protein
VHEVKSKEHLKVKQFKISQQLANQLEVWFISLAKQLMDIG